MASRSFRKEREGEGEREKKNEREKKFVKEQVKFGQIASVTQALFDHLPIANSNEQIDCLLKKTVEKKTELTTN